MIDEIVHVNWLSVLTASAANFMLGGVWFANLVGR